MKVKAKIFLLAVAPFLIALAGIGIGVRLQATVLAKAQHATVAMTWIGAIALGGFGVIAACALVFNFTKIRSADAKLKRLALQVVESQEQERARLSRELHDGISQMMVSVKLLLESALARLESSAEPQTRVPSAQAALSTALARLSDALRELRRISHAPRPAMLDDLGLAAALEQLTREFGEGADLDITFRHVAHDPARTLPDALNTALFRIAQEALTNSVRHSHAAHATLELRLSEHAVTLSIADNGCGFDIERVQADARRGIGLRNMRERLDALGGTLSIASQPYRTVVTAHVPLPRAQSGPAPRLDHEVRNA
jgi:two-component system, NarL family, sensor kinase